MTSAPKPDRRATGLAGPMRNGPREGDGRAAHASPALLYIACVLALLLAILQVDLHRDRLEQLGFASAEMNIALATIHP